VEYHRKYAQEKSIPLAKERYQSDPEFRRYHAEAIKRWYNSDKGKAFRESPERKKYSREYGQKNRERTRIYEREKYHNDSAYYARVRAKNNTRLERERAGGGSLTQNDWLKLLELADGKCLSCGKERKLTMDHIKPVLMGGKTDLANVQPLCGRCNSSKGTQTIDYREPRFIYWLQEYL
jgi:5-methylcytosine-specific restriction endonuclease McrA